MSAFTSAVDDGLAVVTFDLPGEPVNKLTSGVIDEWEVLLEQLRGDASVRAVVLISGKPDTFIAGADIEEFSRLTSAADIEALSRRGQDVAERVEQFPKPIVAAIHGACLGGGCELVLACHWRVASDSPKTQIGLPEVQLGLLPGVGGCVRLPRLIGARAALDIILAGKAERPQKALKIGLVDEVVPKSILRSVALAAADRLSREGIPRRGGPGGPASALLDGTPMGRQIVYRMARKQVLKKTGGHYPAPLAALEVVRIGLEQGPAEGYRAERERFGALAVSPVSRNLVRIFFATTALKKDDGGGGVEVTPLPIRRLGVVGSGFMGAAIAGTAVLNAEVESRLKDSELARVGKGLRAALSILDERLKRRRLSRPQYQRLAALLSGSADYSGFTRADLVIEAVFEDLVVKRRVLAEVEAEIRPEAIFATNTSTIPIRDIAAGANRPERVIGMHFFSPVDRMPLLEVIPTDRTDARTVASVVRFGRAMGKTVIVVADRPGFWVNRILSPYLNEAGVLVEEGVPIDLIDRTMTRWGFPVGPVALMDEVGLDVAQKASSVMHAAFGERMAPPALIGRMLEDERLGRKNARGFYIYHEGHKTGVDERVYRILGVKPLEGFAYEDVQRRLVYLMLNEAARAFAEGVVARARDGDVGAIFGIGFPPFRGGPLRLIDELSAGNLV
ncbi:MAG TPA: 3-hydroxyacyl-CoA dehydrogenase NAD-binding domain-containing protein, partial [Gemmatimonadales bacterium]|nr:3-hydroxyacyl-CoA dehydrogenase NAD-binding domain-containing protein [Gemmatimonadales bacterium]